MEKTSDYIWYDVHERADRHAEARVRGFATCLIATSFLICFFAINPSALPKIDPLELLLGALALLISIFMASYAAGYVGYIETPSGYLIGATSRTDLKPGSSDNPLGVPPSWISGWRNTLVMKHFLGVLALSPTQLSGVVSLPIGRISHIAHATSREVQIRAERSGLFAILSPMRTINLVFRTEVDAGEFAARASALTHRPDLPSFETKA